MNSVLRLIALIFVLANVSFAQPPQITVTGTTTWVDPGKTYEYTFGGLPDNCSSNYIGSFSGGFNQGSNTTNTSLGKGPHTIKWENNLENFSISVTGGNCGTNSLPVVNKPVSHIYLGSPGSFMINGNVSNSLYSCNASPVVMSVDVPSTNPSFHTTNPGSALQLTYTWNIPSWGINNVQTTTNQLSVNPPQNVSSYISVEVKRNDALVSTIRTGTIDRVGLPVGDITGPNTICGGNTYQYNVIFGSPDPYLWEVTTGSYLFSGSTQGSGATANLTPNAGASGNATIAFYVNNGCGGPTTVISKNISIGPPTVSNGQVNGSPANGPTIYVPGGYGYLYANINGGTSANWYITNGSGSLYPSYNNCTISFSSFARVVVDASNSCGVGGSWTFYVSTQQGYYGYKVGPNPTSDNISILMETKEMAGELIQDVSLYNEKSKLCRSIGSDILKKGRYDKSYIDMNVGDLPRGTYFLHIKTGEDTQKHQVLLK